MAAVSQTISCSVTIGGVEIADVTQISTSAGRLQRNSACTITTGSPPSGLAYSDDVVVDLEINGVTATIFRGDYTGRTWSLDRGRTVSLPCTGILARLAKPWGGPERAYGYLQPSDERQTDAGIIRNLIEAYGIDSARHRIFESEWLNVDGVTVEYWKPGDLQLVLLKTGEAALPLIEALDTPPRFVTYDQPQGFIDRTRNSPYYAHPTADYTYTEGQDGIRIERLGPLRGDPRNQSTVTGLTWRGIPVDGTYSRVSALVNGLYPPELRPAYISDPLRTELLEYAHYCQLAAAIRVQDLDVGVDGFRITLAGDAAQHQHQLAETIALNYTSLGSSGASRHRVESIEHAINFENYSYTTTLTTNGGTLLV